MPVGYSLIGADVGVNLLRHCACVRNVRGMPLACMPIFGISKMGFDFAFLSWYNKNEGKEGGA